MALGCLLLGPAMASLAVLGWGGARLVDYLSAQSEVAVSVPPLHRLVLEFSDRAAVYLALLGLVFAGAGIVARRRGPNAPRALIAGAWAGIAAMVILAAVWSWVVVDVGLGWPFHLVGLVTHAFQAYLLYRAARVVRRASPCDSMHG